MTENGTPWTFYWRTGDREVLHGTTPTDALNRAGVGAGALGALDFYSDGDTDGYVWDAEAHRWASRGLNQ